MMRFVGNTVAKSCRRGMQYRGFSSATVVTTGNKVVNYGFKGAFCCVGYVLGGLTSSPTAKQVLEAEQEIIRDNQFMDEHEANIEAAMKP